MINTAMMREQYQATRDYELITPEELLRAMTEEDCPDLYVVDLYHQNVFDPMERPMSYVRLTISRTDSLCLRRKEALGDD